MNFTLYSNGKLLPNANEDKAMQAILKVSPISEGQARVLFLSGIRKKISSSDDKDKMKKIAIFLRQAGVDVSLVAEPEKKEEAKKEQEIRKDKIKKEEESLDVVERKSKKAASVNEAPIKTEKKIKQPKKIKKKIKKKGKGCLALIFTIFILLLLIIGGLGAYGWHWLYNTTPESVPKVEEALADGNMVAISYVDMEKLIFLDKYLLGDNDPYALPMSDESQNIVEKLFTGSADFKKNLKQAYFSVHSVPDEKRVNATITLKGNFDAQAIIRELDDYYKITTVSNGRWIAVENQPLPTEPEVSPCKSEKKTLIKKIEPTTLYIQISPTWVMVGVDDAASTKLWQRLHSNAAAGQDIKKWRNYRKKQLAALMVFTPEEAVQAISGLPGIIAKGAAKKSPHIKGAAAAIAADIPTLSLNLNLSLYSNDIDWNRETADEARNKIAAIENDSRQVSPAFAKLFSRLTFTDDNDLVGLDAKLDSAILGDVESIFEEGLASIFSPSISSGGKEESQKEKIDKNPANYNLYAGLTKLPQAKADEHRQPPLFKDGAYIVDLKSAAYKKDGSLQLEVEGSVAVKKGADFSQPNIEKFRLSIDSVEGKKGNNLLIDERCITSKDFYGTLNHEVEKNFSKFNDKAILTKRLRLLKGTNPEDIAKISGKVNFSVPVNVKKIKVKGQSGEKVEHRGVRFYLSSIKGGTVNYSVSGDFKKILEVRALNKAGKVLKSSWSMNSNGEGRSTRNFYGEVHGIELFIAEKIFKEEKVFHLTNLWKVSSKKKGKAPNFFAPKSVSPKKWAKYAKKNMRNLKVNYKDWHTWGKNKKPIANKKWSDALMYVTHTPQKWGNNPVAHLYLPMLPELPGVLSAMSYVVDSPAIKKGKKYYYQSFSYGYNSKSGKLSTKHMLKGLPVTYQQVPLRSGLKENAKLKRLKGKFVFRLPTKTYSKKVPLNKLKYGINNGGVKVTLKELNRGMFPGYLLKIDGKLHKLVNVHGISSKGKRVKAIQTNYQDDGYWTTTLPFGITQVEIVVATKQKVLKYPFNLRAKYGK